MVYAPSVAGSVCHRNLECALHDNITRRSVICTDDASYHGVGGLYAPIGQSQRKRVC